MPHAPYFRGRLCLRCGKHNCKPRPAASHVRRGAQGRARGQGRGCFVLRRTVLKVREHKASKDFWQMRRFLNQNSVDHILAARIQRCLAA